MSVTLLSAIRFRINSGVYFRFPTNIQYAEAGKSQLINYTFYVGKAKGKLSYLHISNTRILQFKSN